jgi:hypothetical protein
VSFDSRASIAREKYFRREEAKGHFIRGIIEDKEEEYSAKAASSADPH